MPVDYAQFLMDTDQKVFDVVVKATERLPIPEEARRASFAAERKTMAIRNEHSGNRARILKAICEATGAEPFVGLLVLQQVPQLAFVFTDASGAEELLADTVQQVKIIVKGQQKGDA